MIRQSRLEILIGRLKHIKLKSKVKNLNYKPFIVSSNKLNWTENEDLETEIFDS